MDEGPSGWCKTLLYPRTRRMLGPLFCHYLRAQKVSMEGEVGHNVDALFRVASTHGRLSLSYATRS